MVRREIRSTGSQVRSSFFTRMKHSALLSTYNHMADLHEWLSRLKNYGERVASQYMSGAQQTEGLPGELRVKGEMMDQAHQALDPQVQLMQPMAPAPAMAPYAPASSGYTPIGGQNALDQLYQGHPPDLRQRPRSTGVTMKQDSGPGF